MSKPNLEQKFTRMIYKINTIHCILLLITCLLKKL